MIDLKPLLTPTYRIEEASVSLKALFRWWLNVPDPRIDQKLQLELQGHRDTRYLCGDYVFWLGKEDDRRDAIRTMARWSDLSKRRVKCPTSRS